MVGGMRVATEATAAERAEEAMAADLAAATAAATEVVEMALLRVGTEAGLAADLAAADLEAAVTEVDLEAAMEARRGVEAQTAARVYTSRCGRPACHMRLAPTALWSDPSARTAQLRRIGNRCCRGFWHRSRVWQETELAS